MSSADIDEIYAQHIKPLPTEDRLKLLALVARDLAQQKDSAEGQKTRSIMELHGLGKEIWEGIEAQDYVNELRNEWDHHP
ncbi:MAG TPA: hypothetical protein VK619_13290 [Pyrinomonadaceae bacterium]|nr:hypothetical protein [Pyrinomonadaceae bacterium]